MKKHKIVITHSKYKGYQAQLLEHWFTIPLFDHHVWVQINVARGKVATIGYYITQWEREYKISDDMIFDTTGEGIY